MKLLGVLEVNDAGVLPQRWPQEIVVTRKEFDDVKPLTGSIAIGRHGALNISVKNGFAHYWRTEDVADGWRYRLEYCTYQDPVPA
jgi:hypothetical protein